MRSMQSSETFSCFLIGADTLLTECGEVLLQKGHDIKGVITSAPRISQWAHSKSLAVIPEKGGYIEALRATEFDYLFSITHLAIIKDDVLQLPKKMAVNFHDGPLPAYAGLNTPAWALMNRETRYGISWHQITPGVDEGDLLKQAFFDIAPDETSLSVNTKCFAAALESFPVLVDELNGGNEQRTAQDLSGRSYFGKFKRPEQMAVLDWEKPAIELEALVRALDFGEYPNLLSCPKILLGDQCYLVSSAVAREAQSDEVPGTVLQVEEGQIDVACARGVLSLTGFQCFDNQRLTPGELLTKHTDLDGARLARLANDTEEVSESLARNDEYWAKALAYLDPVELPYCSQTASGDERLGTHALVSAVSANAQDVATALVILLARINRKDEFDLALACPSMARDAALAPAVINSHGVAHFIVDAKASIGDISTNVERQLDKAMARGSWAKDLIVRTPALNKNPELCAGSALPVAMVIGASLAVPGALVSVCISDEGAVSIVYKCSALTDAKAEQFTRQLSIVLDAVVNQPAAIAGEIELLSQDEKRKILEEWNATQVAYDNSECIHHLFEQRVEQHPNATALVFEDESVTYAELNNFANQLAIHLIEKGIGPDDLVGVNVNRSIDLMIATIGVHKAGAAYVPLDPAFPADRIAYMMKDANMRLVITQESIQAELPATDAEVITVDSFVSASESAVNPQVDMSSAHLAYVIYTSGSTGNPKGVMVEHRNATNFFVGMDERIEHQSPGTWLAVTSLSFDISVLELFWTLTRGFKVVIYRENRGKQENRRARKLKRRPMGFGLFMWGNDDGPGSDKYKLMIEGSKYFDQNGFESVWTPERHFSAFGGPYPNPAVTSAAIAAITENISIRSGSIVSPLHHPVRIAEDWAVVDNLSNGRVGLSFAAGWQPNDFVIMPQNHKNNKQVMLEQIDVVKRLWRGEKVEFENPMGTMVPTETLPRPVQPELPVWLTTAGNPETYRMAGELGLNVLTHLLGQSLDELTEKIRIYRKARQEAGHDPAAGKVTLMLHTFVGTSDDEVRELVREPMKDYLRSAMKLVIDFAWSFPAFKRPGGQEGKPEDINIKNLTEEETDTILNFAFERYYETSGLFGTVETCLKMVERCKATDIDEIACLLDFGVDTAKVMNGLPLLKDVREISNQNVGDEESSDDLDQSWAAQVDRHEVSHFQCTPSMARMLGFDDDARQQFPKLKHMMVGGEAFPNALAQDLSGLLSGRLTNMYGPTETTIWSTTQDVDNPANIPIGRPIANTDIYILDENKQPVPVGVPGDLFIGGQGVVRGYLNREELTAERFVKDPFRNDDSRMYWTGDLARYREDGVIEFLGRIDHQVKIRGYRVELGEIEALLGKHDAVRECVLLLRDDNQGDQRLVAYFVPSGAAPAPADLREYLRNDLPEYMVPNDFIVMDAMPLTPNGKLDRKQLPEPSQGAAVEAAEYQAPESDLQQTIAEVWQATLQLDKVGTNDNFFDLGGHSLLIVRVHQLLKERVDKPISLTDLYRFPTIKSLTDFLNSDDGNESLKKSSDRASRRRQRLGLRSRGRK